MPRGRSRGHRLALSLGAAGLCIVGVAGLCIVGAARLCIVGVAAWQNRELIPEAWDFHVVETGSPQSSA